MPTKLVKKRLNAKTGLRSEMSQSRHIPYTRMVDHSTIKTREGAMMRILQIEGWPFETTDDDQIDALKVLKNVVYRGISCLLYTSPSPRDRTRSRMPSSA